MMRFVGPRAAAIWAVVIGITLASISCSQAAFLSSLPLKLDVTTPIELLSPKANTTVTLSGRQTITAVFSRPVIALGSDFGANNSFGGKVPFRLTCAVPGRFRWVTTYIARFDPDLDWPTDLACRLLWNTDLESYDGVPFQPPANPSVALRTQPLSFQISSVTSELAENYTDGVWSATSGLKDDILPEVPPDGKIELSFSYPVNLLQLQSALLASPVVKPGKLRGRPSPIAIAVSPCSSSPEVYPLRRPQSEVLIPDYLNTNSSCAQVTILGNLETATQYVLTLPKGSRYNALSGRLTTTLNATFGGLRQFRLPLNPNFQDLNKDDNTVSNGISYRRLQLWLVHGLARTSSLGDLAAAISLCYDPEPFTGATRCNQVRFTLTRENNGTVRMTVPTLIPHTRYTLTVAASPSVRDGFGLPLMASTNTWWTTDLPDVFQGPNVQSSDNSVVFAAGSALAWPFITRGSTGRFAGYWQLDVTDQKTMEQVFSTLANSYQATYPSALGPQDGSLGPSRSVQYQRQQLSLRGAPQSVYLVHTCCNTINWPTERQTSISLNLVSASSLSLSIIQGTGSLTAWLMDLAGDAAPVRGGSVTLYQTDYSDYKATVAGRCTTGADGSCTIPLASSGRYSSAQLAAVAVYGDQAALLPSAGFTSTPYRQKYVASVILDRALVKPGDSLHVTGYIQQQVGDSLQLPSGVTDANITIYPNFVNGNYTTMIYTVPLDPAIGSIHAAIEVPETAQRTQYSVSVQIGDWTAYGRSQMTVSDPRPPTAELTVTAPKWARPNASVPISVKAVSYIGADVSDANITVRWTAGVNGQGVVYIMTDRNGRGEASIDLAALPPANATKDGDQLYLTVEWIGPTRERIVESASTSLATSPRQLSLTTSGSTQLPGLPFLVTTSASSLLTGDDITDVPVTITLTPGSDTECPNTRPQSCTTSTGAFFTDRPRCSLTLPCPGTFTLKACTTDDRADVACTNITLGRNLSDWQQQPWNKQPDFSLTPVPGEVALGGTAKYFFNNPWQGAVALLRWGNGFSYQHKVINKLAQGPVELSFVAGPECKGGCGVSVVLALGDNPLGSRPPAVPTSKLFDPLAPFTTSASTTLNIDEDRSLNVTLDLGADKVLAPGASTTWGVSVTRGGESVPGAEVTIMAVDKAILDLMPYPLQDPTTDVKVAVDTYQRLALQAARIPAGAVDDVYSTAMRRTVLDPWVPVDTTIAQTYYYGGAAPVDQNDTTYLDRYTSDITIFPSSTPSFGFGRPPFFQFEDSLQMRPLPVAMPMPAAVPMPVPVPTPVAVPTPTPAGNKAAAPSSAGGVRAQSDFTTTALFRVFKTTSDGSGRVTFNAPANLGTFVVRAYAATGEAQYGAAESEVVVRRKVSLTPSTPRFVRVGDKFEAGALVTLAGAGSATITVTIQVPGGSPLRLTSPSPQRQVVLGGTAPDQLEVRFSFDAIAIGDANFTISASDGEGSEDAVQLDLPVEAQQGPVLVATSFVVSGNASSAPGQWKEGLALPSAVPGSGSLDLTMGVGYLPAVLAISDSVANAQPEYPDGSHALAVSTWVPALAIYNSQPDNSSAVTTAVKDLRTLTVPKYGLQYSDPSRWGWTVNSCPITLNSQAYWLATTYPKPPSSNTFSAQWGTVLGLTDNWLTALSTQLTNDAIAARTDPISPGPYSDMSTLAWARLALGPRWSPPRCAANQNQGDGNPPCANTVVANDLSFSRLTSRVQDAGLQEQLLVGLTLVGSPAELATNAGVLGTVLGTVLSGLRVQGQTAYLAAATGSATPAPLLDQSLALLLLTLTNTNNQLVPKLAAYVAAGQVAAVYTDVFVSVDDMTQAFRVKALSSYDRSTSSATPNLSVDVRVGDETLLAATFTQDNADEVVSSSTPWEDLPQPPPPLEFSANGTGQVSIAAALSFVPAELLTYPSYRGIWVESIIRGQDPATGTMTGPALSTVPLASVVTITVQLTTPDDLGAATLEVWLPGGLEAVDPNVASDSGAATTCSLGESLGSYRPYWWWWPVCPAQETFTDKVVFRWQYMRAGTSSVQFLAVAASAGKFVLPPSKAYATQQPEVMGLTAGGDFTVCVPPCAPVAAAAQPPAKACPDDCSGNGMCNISDGTCKCNPGFGSENCSQLATR